MARTRKTIVKKNSSPFGETPSRKLKILQEFETKRLIKKFTEDGDGVGDEDVLTTPYGATTQRQDKINRIDLLQEILSKFMDGLFWWQIESILRKMNLRTRCAQKLLRTNEQFDFDDFAKKWTIVEELKVARPKDAEEFKIPAPNKEPPKRLVSMAQNRRAKRSSLIEPSPYTHGSVKTPPTPAATKMQLQKAKQREVESKEEVARLKEENRRLELQIIDLKKIYNLSCVETNEAMEKLQRKVDEVKLDAKKQMDDSKEKFSVKWKEAGDQLDNAKKENATLKIRLNVVENTFRTKFEQIRTSADKSAQEFFDSEERCTRLEMQLETVQKLLDDEKERRMREESEKKLLAAELDDLTKRMDTMEVKAIGVAPALATTRKFLQRANNRNTDQREPPHIQRKLFEPPSLSNMVHLNKRFNLLVQTTKHIEKKCNRFDAMD